MAYNLWTNGVTDVDRVARLFNKQTRAHEPLSGLVDGVNTYFYTQYHPLLTSGSMGLYTSGSAPLSSTDYVVDYDAGLVTFTAAPSVQPSATYQTAKFPEMTMRSILVAGFDEMENIWYRGLCLSETTGSGVTYITEDSSAAYITDSSGSAPFSVNGVLFENSRAQIGFFVKCVQLAFYRTLMGEHAQSSYIWKESGGLTVDKSMITKNLKMALDEVNSAIQKAKDAIQYEWYGNALWGGSIPTPYTRDFISHRWWQKKSLDENWRDNTTYQGDRW